MRTRLTSTSLRAKLLITIGAVGATAAVAGLGTFGAFTSTTAAQSGTYATGTVVLDYGTSTTTNRLTVGASGMVPGDSAQRGFTLRNSGTQNMASVKLSLSATTSSALDTDAINGLTMQIQGCSVGWVESLTTPYTYTCAGTVTTPLALTPVATLISTGPTTLTNLASLTAGSSDSLVATFALPAAANNTVQGLSSTLSVSFTGTQRTGTSQ